jgi:AcrR family transcriptional regulator
VPEPDPRRKAEILALATDYVLEHGLSDLSLRPLAAALDTSGRMLIYYFGSKDQLVIDILAEARRRQYAGWARQSGGTDVLLGYWAWATSAPGRRFLRLTHEIYGLSLREPDRFGAFLQSEAVEVLGEIEASFRRAGVSALEARLLSTYTFATLRGLELDMLGTNDLARVKAAFDLFHADLERRLRQAIAHPPADDLNRVEMTQAQEAR